MTTKCDLHVVDSNTSQAQAKADNSSDRACGDCGESDRSSRAEGSAANDSTDNVESVNLGCAHDTDTEVINGDIP